MAGFILRHSVCVEVSNTVCLKKTGSLRLTWHNFTNSQHLLIIIEFSVDYVKKFLSWLEPAAQFP